MGECAASKEGAVQGDAFTIRSPSQEFAQFALDGGVLVETSKEAPPNR